MMPIPTSDAHRNALIELCIRFNLLIFVPISQFKSFLFLMVINFVFCRNIFDLPDHVSLFLDWATLCTLSGVALVVLVDGSSIASHALFYWHNGTKFSCSHYIGPLSSPHCTPLSLQIC